MNFAKNTVEFDIVQYLTGEEAARAAKEDDKSAEDYYVRNANPRLMTLGVGPNVVVVMSLPNTAGRTSACALPSHPGERTPPIPGLIPPSR